MEKQVTEIDVEESLRAAYLSLSVAPEARYQVENSVRILAGLARAVHEDGGTSRVPPRFRNVNRATCEAELKRLAHQLQRVVALDAAKDGPKVRAAIRRLLGTIDELHQPTILAIADRGMDGGWRVAVQKIAQRVRVDGMLNGDSRELFAQVAHAAETARTTLRVQRAKEGSSRGRGRDPFVRHLSNFLYRDYEALTGRRPTITVDPTRVHFTACGSFLTYMTAVFAVMRLDASPEAAARQVIAEHRRAR